MSRREEDGEKGHARLEQAAGRCCRGAVEEEQQAIDSVFEVVRIAT
jgi:hypothetical protein